MLALARNTADSESNMATDIQEPEAKDTDELLESSIPLS